jgi:uncharacterized protein YhdP
VSRVDPANPPVNRKVDNHTPGPWVVSGVSGRTIQRQAGNWRAVVGDTKVGESIPRWEGIATVLQRGKEETEANARLIAAAPELLAAAKDALAKMNVLLALAGDEDPHWRALWAAVRKAEGSQPPPAPEAKREPSPLPPDFTDNDHDGMG